MKTLWVIFLFILVLKNQGEINNQLTQSTNGIHIFNLYIIVDSDLYQQNLKNVQYIEKRIQSIFILINKIYMPLRIQFQIIYIELWTVNVIDQSTEENMIYDLKKYKLNSIDIYHDCLHAFIGSKHRFTKYGYGELMSMCSKSSCIGYTMDSNENSIKDTAYIAAHELAHNFGVQHDTSDCQCSNCIMATGIELSSRILVWSPCSLSQFRSFLNVGYTACKPSSVVSNSALFAEINDKWLRNKVNLRNSIIDISICGNGLQEKGEECDCGKLPGCEKCCNKYTCKLTTYSKCASGQCCNMDSCDFLPLWTVCRPTQGYCDLPEYCNGMNNKCGKNIYKHDGTKCYTEYNEMSYCINGKCKNHLTQCKYLWGNTAKKSSVSCYEANMIKNDVFKNCGVNIGAEQNENYDSSLKWETKSCTKNNYLCGRLWCSHENERILQLGLSKTISYNYNHLNFCESSRFELDWRNHDIGMVPDGAACGDNSLCLNSQCVSVKAVLDHNCSCSGNFICDNRKTCQCLDGYLPPDCKVKLPLLTLPNTRSSLTTSISTKIIDSTVNGNSNAKPSGKCTDPNITKYIETINSLKIALIFSSLSTFILLFILFYHRKLKRLKYLYVIHLKLPSFKFTNETSYKASFFQKKIKFRNRKYSSTKTGSHISEETDNTNHQMLPVNITSNLMPENDHLAT